MRLRRAIQVIAVCAALYVGFMVMASAIAWLSPAPKPVPDEAFEQWFYTNRTAFAEMKELLAANPLLLQPSNESPGASDEAWQKYTSLRVKTGVWSIAYWK